MDTKLRNYDGGYWTLKTWLCLAAGLGFVSAAVNTVEAFCRLTRIYDLHYLCLGVVFDTENAYKTDEVYYSLTDLLETYWRQTAIFGIAMAALLILCCILTSRKMTWFDKIFVELQLCAFAAAATGTAFLMIEYYENMYQSTWIKDLVDNLDFTEKEKEIISGNWGWPDYIYNNFEPEWLFDFAVKGGIIVLLAICLLILLSWVKKCKAGCFWHYTLIGRVFIAGRDAIGDAIRNRKNVQGKVMGILIIGAILSATWIGLIAVLVFIFFFVPRQVKKFKAIRDGVEEVKSGNLDYKISTLRPGEKPGELDRLAMGINEISSATSIAVANELKNQRLKTDLISNVSHDLKTPLTSMVSYVDLLKTEGLDSEHAAEYLDIIDEKTRRLQKLTEDLFEAAKASSGSIPVNLEHIEMTAIAQQALAELEGRLSAADLEVIFEDKTGGNSFVEADGQLLWRVMENLLVNTSKYALPGSRVYIDVTDAEDRVKLEIKNMSKDRLNIDADELLERFKRGDESRNTEGSGLGLAIAKDLVALMNGQFSIKVDGDLFKVTVALKKV